MGFKQVSAYDDTRRCTSAAGTVMRRQRIYIAGPMTGLPEYNYPAFNAEAKRLRSLGYHVENPAENPPQEHQANPWQHYMRMAVAQMVTCDAVALLPNWARSRGALLEYGLAERVGIPCYPAHTFTQAAEVA